MLYSRICLYFIITFSWVTFLSGCGGGDSGPQQPASIPTEYKATLEIAVRSTGADMSSDLGLGVDTDAHGPTILVDGKPKLFAKWTDTVEVEVDIRNTHILVPKPLVIDSAQKITRCTAATQTLASLKSGLDKIQVNYHCIASGVLAQCTQSDAANLNTAYGALDSKMPTELKLRKYFKSKPWRGCATGGRCWLASRSISSMGFYLSASYDAAI